MWFCLHTISNLDKWRRHPAPACSGSSANGGLDQITDQGLHGFYSNPTTQLIWYNNQDNPTAWTNRTLPTGQYAEHSSNNNHYYYGVNYYTGTYKINCCFGKNFPPVNGTPTTDLLNCASCWCPNSSLCSEYIAQYCFASSTGSNGINYLDDPRCQQFENANSTNASLFNTYKQQLCQGSNLELPVCADYCALTGTNCDTALQNYCSSLSESTQIATPACQCFLPSGFYSNILNSINELLVGVPETANITCYYAPCANSSSYKSYNEKNEPVACPSIFTCINNVNIDNTGQINGISINPTNACQQSLVNGGSTGSTGTINTGTTGSVSTGTTGTISTGTTGTSGGTSSSIGGFYNDVITYVKDNSQTLMIILIVLISIAILLFVISMFKKKS